MLAHVGVNTVMHCCLRYRGKLAPSEIVLRFDSGFAASRGPAALAPRVIRQDLAAYCPWWSGRSTVWRPTILLNKPSLS